MPMEEPPLQMQSQVPTSMPSIRRRMPMEEPPLQIQSQVPTSMPSIQRPLHAAVDQSPESDRSASGSDVARLCWLEILNLYNSSVQVAMFSLFRMYTFLAGRVLSHLVLQRIFRRMPMEEPPLQIQSQVPTSMPSIQRPLHAAVDQSPESDRSASGSDVASIEVCVDLRMPVEEPPLQMQSQVPTSMPSIQRPAHAAVDESPESDRSASGSDVASHSSDEREPSPRTEVWLVFSFGFVRLTAALLLHLQAEEATRR
eukprot:symbB.v1.2.002284.t1/scaffold100.1/size330964/8